MSRSRGCGSRKAGPGAPSSVSRPPRHPGAPRGHRRRAAGGPPGAGFPQARARPLGTPLPAAEACTPVQPV